MVDYLSRYRLYNLGYSRPTVRQSCPSLSELYKTSKQHLFKSGVTPTHDCRPEFIKDHVDTRDWETQLLCHGLRKTCADLEALRTNKATEDETKRKDKLLFHIGLRGSGDGDFCYPRGMAITDQGDLVIADTSNHRVQVLSPYGVFKFKFGEKGEGDGQFNQPTGVTVLPNNKFVISDSKNRRLQVFHRNGRFDYSFPTNGVPYSVTCDTSYNICVGTLAKTVEMYSRDGKFVSKFRTTFSRVTKGASPVLVRCNSLGEIVLLDPQEKLVKIFTQTGKLLHQFEPELSDDGLALTTSCISVNPKDQIILGDSLNHTVSVYTEKGHLLGQIIGPADNLGPIQSCDVGPEGHLAVTEFSVTGEHSVKIFRFSECICHLNRPGSSKRKTLTSSPTKDRPVSGQSKASAPKPT